MDSPRTPTIHQCPPEGSGIMPCCGRTPFEVPQDRMTLDPALVTCGLQSTDPSLSPEVGERSGEGET